MSDSAVRVISLSLSQSGFTSAHLVCTTRATARWSKTFENACIAFSFGIAEGPFTCHVFCSLKFIISNVNVRQALIIRFFMKYMHAIGQHKYLSLANGLLLVHRCRCSARWTIWEPFRGDARCSKKIIFESQNRKSNANPPNEYSNNKIFWSSSTMSLQWLWAASPTALQRSH